MESGERRRPRRQRWDRNEVLSKIRQLPDRSAKAVQRATPALYGAAVRIFGSWRAAITASGQDYGSIRKRRQQGYWTAEQVVTEIRLLQEKSSSSVRKQRADLYSAALRLFSSWRNAIEAAGIDYDRVHRGWVSRDAARLRFRKNDPPEESD